MAPVVGVLDIENVGPRPWVKRTQHPQPALLHAELTQLPGVVAPQRDDQIRLQVVRADLGGAVIGGVAVGVQHLPCPFVGPIADVPVAGAGAGHPHRLAQPAFPQLVGEHLLGHRRATDVAGTHESDVQR